MKVNFAPKQIIAKASNLVSRKTAQITVQNLRQPVNALEFALERNAREISPQAYVKARTYLADLELERLFNSSGIF